MSGPSAARNDSNSGSAKAQQFASVSASDYRASSVLSMVEPHEVQPSFARNQTFSRTNARDRGIKGLRCA